MNTAFSFSRLGKLILKHGIENSRLYGMTILAMVGAQALIFIFWILAGGAHYTEDATYVFYIFGLIICGTIFSSMAFSMLGDKSKGIYWLSLPASHAEKLVTIIFYTTVVFFLVFSAAFFLIKQLAVGYIFTRPGVIYRSMNWNQGFGEVMPYFIYGYFAVQALYLLGSVYFSRFSFIKTTVLGAALIFMFIFYCKMLNDNFLPQGFYWNGFDVRDYSAHDGQGVYTYSLSSSAQDILGWFLKLIWAPVFWVVTWFRLREKEI